MDIDYFISFYTKIPDTAFTLSTSGLGRDAYEWLSLDEQEALYQMVKPYGLLTACNDGEAGYESYGVAIKTRIINFLLTVKKNRERL